ncbi:hypothetical protein DGI_0162 [Megalodesulfovibrio gigas DSM 1382 = ATCC 19364]|uniref:Uncharacterized protein n=2 Tax=Megalodesulfovibrio gigas TaxID=879 RepID=T2G7E3_MEGG1|nr:hypothetical protein DGI_0162 [Megalodesulfovibrio gigas DSM 1382 = ATCC 19364]
MTDTGLNGGPKGRELVVPGARHNLFPRVTRTEREAGIIRHRKQYFVNENPESEPAWGVVLFLEHPSMGEDSFAIALGTQQDTQQQLLARAPAWMGVGRLATELTGGETAVQLVMEDADTVFENGGLLHLSNRFLVQQTVHEAVRPGDAVLLDNGTWRSVDRLDTGGEILHPYGLYLGGDTVLTVTPSSREEWLRIADRLHEGEVLTTGNGLSYALTLTSLAHAADGVCRVDGKTPVLTAVCGGQVQTVTVNRDGQCSGYCTAGALQMDTGVWSTPVSWNTPPDAGTAVTISYRERAYRSTGSAVTVLLNEQVTGAYGTANTVGAGCLEMDSLQASADGWIMSSTAGTYDHAGHPPVLPHDGVEEDSWTLTFTSATSFLCAGLQEGDVGAGSVASPFSPVNASAGVPYFVLDPAGFAGIFAAGDTIAFSTHPAAVPVWMRQTVPAGAPEISHNLMVLGWYCE